MDTYSGVNLSVGTLTVVYKVLYLLCSIAYLVECGGLIDRGGTVTAHLTNGVHAELRHAEVHSP